MSSPARGGWKGAQAFPVLILGSAVLVLPGCQLAGGSSSPNPGPTPPSVLEDPIPIPEPEREEDTGPPWRVVYQGTLSLDGGAVPSGLEIARQEGGALVGTLQISTGMVATGEGRLRGQALSLDLGYGGECPGRMSFEGTWDQQAQIYEGRLEAVDCTGTANGTFRFSGNVRGESPSVSPVG